MHLLQLLKSYLNTTTFSFVINWHGSVGGPFLCERDTWQLGKVLHEVLMPIH